jgi:putative hydrolase of the HAD superfamily
MNGGGRMIKAVFFDIDDTLFHFTGRHRECMEKVFSYGEETLLVERRKLEAALTAAMEQVAAYAGADSPVTHNRQIRFQNALDILGKPIYPHATRLYHIYWEHMLDRMEPEPGLIPLLEVLKNQGLYLGVGTDMTSYIQNEKLHRLGVAGYFQAVVTSEEAGFDKPSKRLFELCAKKAGCAMEECLFIGDSLEKDVLGPRKAGMQSICYNRYSKVSREEAGEVITSYQEYKEKWK